MKYWITAAICCLAIGTTAATAAAQTQSQVYRFTAAGKRAWLHDRILSEVLDPAQRANMLASLARMSEFQLDQAISNYFGNLNANRYGGNYYGGGRVVGYQPVITTLPTGASLNAGGVISPDGRSVRINAQPTFSQVGPVRTFNPVTGQSRYYPPPQTPQSGYLNPLGAQRGYSQGYSQGYTQGGRRYNGQQYDPRNPTQVETYHDGLRTRVRRPQ